MQRLRCFHRRTHTHIIAQISEIAQRTNSTETFISKIASIGDLLATLHFSVMRGRGGGGGGGNIAVFEVTKPRCL